MPKHRATTHQRPQKPPEALYKAEGHLHCVLGKLLDKVKRWFFGQIAGDYETSHKVKLKSVGKGAGNNSKRGVCEENPPLRIL